MMIALTLSRTSCMRLREEKDPEAVLIDRQLGARPIFQELEVRDDSNALAGSIDSRRAGATGDDDGLTHNAERLRTTRQFHCHGLSSEWRDVAIDLRFADLVYRLLEDVALLHFIDDGENTEADGSTGDHLDGCGDCCWIGEIRTH